MSVRFVALSAALLAGESVALVASEASLGALRGCSCLGSSYLSVCKGAVSAIAVACGTRAAIEQLVEVDGATWEVRSSSLVAQEELLLLPVLDILLNSSLRLRVQTRHRGRSQPRISRVRRWQSPCSLTLSLLQRSGNLRLPYRGAIPTRLLLLHSILLLCNRLSLCLSTIWIHIQPMESLLKSICEILRL